MLIHQETKQNQEPAVGNVQGKRYMNNDKLVEVSNYLE